jgi:type III secretion system low calcium response chaperone LcrH/SycD
MSLSYTEEELSTLYTAAHQYYETGDYKKAGDLFSLLAKAAPFEPHYWRGLASSQQMQKNYKDALHAWSVAAILHEHDPWVHFHAAECLISEGDAKEAAKALDLAESQCELDDEELMDKIALLKTHYTR